MSECCSVNNNNIQEEAVSAECCAANPLHDYLRMDRMPHIWCPGCGIGVSVNAFIQAFIDTQIPRDQLSIVSGISAAPGAWRDI